MANFDPARVDAVRRMRDRDAARDSRMSAVRLVRTGNSHILFGDIFPIEWPRPVIANTIDVIAQDVAEQVGVLPTFSCAGDSQVDPNVSRRTDKITKIVNYYAWASRLGVNLPTAADRFVTYGFLPVRVEANYDAKRPHIHLDDPQGAYFDKDRWGVVKHYTKIFQKRASELAYLYPEYEGHLLDNSRFRNSQDPWIEFAVSYMPDSTSVIIISGENQGLILSQVDQKLGRVPVTIAERPTLDDENRGAFDDVLWVFAARAKLALMSLEGTQKAVEAPIAMPDDVQEFSIGPDAIIRSSMPEKIRRVGIDIPQSALVENQLLDNEIKFGARFPEARAGQSDASVVTGRGVQALMSGFDARVKIHQSVLGEALNDSLSMCLELDEKTWGSTEREISSVTNGTPYNMKYRPDKDIKGNYAVNYEYGVMAGLDPNRALVWGLQGLGAGLFSKSFMRRNLPISMDVQEEERIIDIEKLRESALEAVAMSAQAIPQMVSAGQDPTEILRVITAVIDSRKRGNPIEDGLAKALEKPEIPASEGAPAGEAVGPQDPMGSQQPPAGGPGMKQQAAPPSLQQLLSQLGTSGRSEMSARTVRQSRL